MKDISTENRKFFRIYAVDSEIWFSIKRALQKTFVVHWWVEASTFTPAKRHTEWPEFWIEWTRKGTNYYQVLLLNVTEYIYTATPLESEQISQIIRNLHVEHDIVKVRESFLDCYLKSEKTAENTT